MDELTQGHSSAHTKGAMLQGRWKAASAMAVALALASMSSAIADPCNTFNLGNFKSDELEYCIKDMKLNQQLLEQRNTELQTNLCMLATFIAQARTPPPANSTDLDGFIKGICSLKK